jgi:hypothetical protein
MPIEVISEIVPKNEATFPVVDDNNIRGGYQTVATVTDMEDIPADKRKEGMQVFVQASSVAYTLESDLVTWNPTEVPSAPTPTFVYNQIISAAIWNINHALNKYPSVTIIDTADRTIEGDVTYVDSNNLTVSFTGPFSGKAFLN